MSGWEMVNTADHHHLLHSRRGKTKNLYFSLSQQELGVAELEPLAGSLLIARDQNPTLLDTKQTNRKTTEKLKHLTPIIITIQSRTYKWGILLSIKLHFKVRPL